ncbi:[LysW]-lysine hydrolase [Halovenus salina]|uniref:[LysW]-lysine hydrolase n=1 Tax=Halovenus salina TaxID=1510225 RepID=UPI002260C632|nr:[LysW]-lysine hydrolase [Halovenus salina]
MSAATATDVRDLLVELVETPSVSGDEDECAERLLAFFQEHGREAFTDEVGNVHAPADDGVLLTSHLDTVPGEVPIRIEQTEAGEPALWGRGSVDAKGPLAAMAVAAVETGASFLGVVGEETDSRGARHVVATRDAPEAVINGEPSGWDAVTLGYRGILTATYEVETESAHAAGPEKNAVEAALSWYDRIEESVATTAGDVFERVTCKPRAVDGGSTDDGMGVTATMDVEFRIPPDETVESVREAVSEATAAGSLSFSEGIEPVTASPRTPVARAFRVAIREAGGEPSLLRKTGTSDMNLFAEAWACPMVTYGPGDSALDHTPNEHLVLSELDRASEVLTTATEQLLNP